jgi:hypothetical protein
MKRLFRFRLTWVGLLAVSVAFSIAGCQTAATRQAAGPRGDAAVASDALGDRACRFG